MKKTVLCGVDVGAKELVVALDPGTGRVWEGAFANDAARHKKLVRRLTRTKATTRVCVEAEKASSDTSPRSTPRSRA